ncbi:MAG: helicase-associated domain-containing protein [Caldilineales bacterium]|nr:helicase-associated domain-containing protein [Caldilineales bacterium]MDW8316401.1 hypothetical protein [Anaerolineae bacterium]
MSDLLHSLLDHPPAMLRAIAEVNGVRLASNAARAMAEQLAKELSDPAYLPAVVASCSLPAQAALRDLLDRGGHMPWTTFALRYGFIRPMGPGRLEREQPHRAPASPAEELWYRGLIFRGFRSAGAGLAEFVYIPADVAQQLSLPPTPVPSASLPAQPAPSRVHAFGDGLLHDMGTLLAFVQAGQAQPATAGTGMAWRSSTLYELRRFLLHPPPSDEDFSAADAAGPAALVLTLAHELGWVRRSRGRWTLDHRAAHEWLAAPRAVQRRTLLDAWRTSTAWNDLCRTPSLRCEATGSWANDPTATRARVLPLALELLDDRWASLADLIAAIRRLAPDFQRGEDGFDTWYVRLRAEPRYLRGVEHWDAVEGALLRFLFTGPLFWLGAVELDATEVAEAVEPLRPTDHAAVHWTAAGRAWLAGDPPPPEPCDGRIAVLPDFTVVVPADAPLLERFRVSRFTTWTPGGPPFRYRITQNGLRRAAAQGITAQRILAYLREQVGDALPPNVARALERWRARPAVAQARSR